MNPPENATRGPPSAAPFWEDASSVGDLFTRAFADYKRYNKQKDDEAERLAKLQNDAEVLHAELRKRQRDLDSGMAVIDDVGYHVEL